MDQHGRNVQNKILIAGILQSGVTDENTPIIVDLLAMEKNELSDLIVFILESMELLTPALKILILDYKIRSIKAYLNLSTEAYIENKEDLIYIKSPRRNYSKLTEEDALKQVFQDPRIKYPIIGETSELIEQIEYFDDEEYIWKKAIRKYLINDVGRVVKFMSEKIINMPNRPAPSLNEDFTYSSLGKDFFQTKISEQELLDEF